MAVIFLTETLYKKALPGQIEYMHAFHSVDFFGIIIMWIGICQTLHYCSLPSFLSVLIVFPDTIRLCLNLMRTAYNIMFSYNHFFLNPILAQ